MATDTLPIQVRDSFEKGRGIFASQDLKPGQTVLQESPANIAVTENSKDKCCSQCFRWFEKVLDNKIGLQCSECEQVWFCDEVCSKAATEMQTHSKWVCSSLRALSLRAEINADLKSTVRWILQLLNSSKPAKLSLLEDTLALDKGKRPYSEEITNNALRSFCFLSELPGNCEMQLSLALVEDLLSADARNSFGLMAPLTENGDRDLRATATYLKSSLFNHSCYPNIARLDYLDSKARDSNTAIIVRVIREVKTGEELFLSYFPINWDLETRESRLKEEYGFECACDRCLLERKWEYEDDDSDNEEAAMDEMEEFHSSFFCLFLCPQSECGGTVVPLEGEGSVEECNLEDQRVECNACGEFFSLKEVMSA